MASFADLTHLLRRAGFGPSEAQLTELSPLAFDEAVDRLCSEPFDPAAVAIPPPTFSTADVIGQRNLGVEEQRALQRRLTQERFALSLWWLRRMVVAERPVGEKLTWLWHDHFATGIDKVRLAELMHRQHQTLAQHALGRFDDLLGAMVRDPAMLVWLDGRESRVGAPNENFALELFELFALGHGGHGNQPYTEEDVAEAARAFTGWQVDPATITGRLVPARHDRGTKTVLGRTGALGADDVVELVTSNRSCAPHVVARLWSRMGRPADPDDEVVEELAAPFARDLGIDGLVRKLLLHEEFRASSTRTALVKTPVEWMVGAARALGATPADWWLRVLAELGQLPFQPPDVAGWPANVAWLSTSSAQLRLQAATRLSAEADRGWLTTVPQADRVDALARRLGVVSWSVSTGKALSAAASDPPLALTLALVSPDYLLD